MSLMDKKVSFYNKVHIKQQTHSIHHRTKEDREEEKNNQTK